MVLKTSHLVILATLTIAFVLYTRWSAFRT